MMKFNNDHDNTKKVHKKNRRRRGKGQSTLAKSKNVGEIKNDPTKQIRQLMKAVGISKEISNGNSNASYNKGVVKEDISAKRHSRVRRDVNITSGVTAGSSVTLYGPQELAYDFELMEIDAVPENKLNNQKPVASRIVPSGTSIQVDEGYFGSLASQKVDSSDLMNDNSYDNGSNDDECIMEDLDSTGMYCQPSSYYPWHY